MNKAQYQKTTLSNGVRIITERHLHSHAVSSGIWICSGARDEKKELMGMSHLLEHMVFKGTRKRSAYQLAKIMESRGGDLNAFTTRESVCFFAASLKKDLKLSLDVLMDVVCNATFPANEFEKEKSVIEQEIAMYFDNHEEYVFDLFSDQVYRGHPMGWSILGTPETISRMTPKNVNDYYKSIMRGENIIVSVCGAVDHDYVVKVVEPVLGKLKKAAPKPRRRKPKFHPFVQNFHRDIEQTHILLGFESPHLKHSLRFASFIVNTALGGGVTSVLFQKIREQRGLAYSVYSAVSNATDSGMTLIYAGTEPNKKDRVVDIIYKELTKLKRNGFSKRLLESYKTQIKGYLLINDDDLESRMSSMCLNEMAFKKYRTTNDILKAIEGTQLSDIDQFIDQYLDLDKIAMLTMGPKS